MAGLIKASLFGVGFVLVVVYVCFFIFFLFYSRVPHTRHNARRHTNVAPDLAKIFGFVSIDLESFFSNSCLDLFNLYVH